MPLLSYRGSFDMLSVELRDVCILPLFQHRSACLEVPPGCVLCCYGFRTTLSTQTLFVTSSCSCSLISQTVLWMFSDLDGSHKAPLKNGRDLPSKCLLMCACPISASTPAIPQEGHVESAVGGATQDKLFHVFRIVLSRSQSEIQAFIIVIWYCYAIVIAKCKCREGRASYIEGPELDTWLLIIEWLGLEETLKII